ncbi:MobF family relaxase [Lacisediminihabitans profunda]|nr:MobF family relaxase [Lacisediminihabitans profunda]
MRVMSAGDGYRYLLKTVAAGDGNRSLTTALTRYYQEKGTPPGFWLGSGIAGLRHGELVPGAEVTESQLQLLLGLGCDPVTGEPLGKAWPTFKTAAERIEARIRNLPAELNVAQRAEAITAIENEERARTRRRAVAGFDLTFSVPKSVSTLWAVADGGTQSLIVQAHHNAVAEILDLMERDVAMTRVGADAGNGSVAQVEVRGLVATAYDHYDSRASDPQLHTHVVIANKVQGAHDGKWRTLDGRPMHAAVVALSEHYNAILADHLARDLGIGWESRERGERRNPAFEIIGVRDDLIGAFSSRSRNIEVAADTLIADYVEKHGRQPSARTILRLRAEATLSTRPEKTIHSLADLTDEWRSRANTILGEDSTTWATNLLARSSQPALLRADDVPLDVAEQIGSTVVEVVGSKRSTWRRWNLHAEASRQLMGVRFVSTVDREAVLGLIVDAAEHGSLRLTPPELASSPAEFRRGDGSSTFRPKHGALFSSAELLAAEDRLLALAHRTNAPTLDLESVERETSRTDARGISLSEDQLAAVAHVAVSGRTVDVLVGPAGTGKTTTLHALRKAWESEHGRGSVIGLAPSAAAAQVLADELDIATENTAKWVHAHQHNGWTFEAEQLVIIDEASLAGTFTLDTIASHAASVGAKLLLVGDWAQLSAVETGGAFAMVARDMEPAAELLDVRRFRNEWEKNASLQLRLGDTTIIDTYLQRRRIAEGPLDGMLDAAYTAWQQDLAAGKASVMIAETNETVTALNERARLDRIITGQVKAAGAITLHDETEASSGDLVITRKNDRTLTTGTGWVKNGDRWTITATHNDGSITVRRPGRRTGASIRLPATYVAENVELAYAVTAHRAQGSTVDTAHAIVHSTQMTRETFYVSMTRGRDANAAYVATDQTQLEEHQLLPDSDVTATTILAAVLNHEGAEKSAHETITIEQNTWAGIGQLAAEYETIAQTAQYERWVSLLEHTILTPGQVDQIIESESFGPLMAELRRAEATQRNVDLLLPRLIAARGLDDADDLGAVIRQRIQHATANQTGSTRRRGSSPLIVGLIPEATGQMTIEMRAALNERKALIEKRAMTIAETDTTAGVPWTVTLGPAPAGEKQRQQWLRQVRVIAAYRDRYQITDPKPLGGEPSPQSRLDHARAQAAIRTAQRIAKDGPAAHEPSRSATERTSPSL